MWSLLKVSVFVNIATMCLVLASPKLLDTISDTTLKYKLFFNAEIWSDARQSCKEDGGELAVPDSKEEFSQLQVIVRNMDYRRIENADIKLIAWLGVSNLEDPNVWRTINNTDVTETGFDIFGSTKDNTGHPNSPRCAGLNAVHQGYIVYWCNRKLVYICQYNNNTDIPTEPLRPQPKITV